MTLSADRLRELLDYDPLTGVFYWKVNRGGTARAGSVAGCLNTSGDGYRRIAVCRRTYLAQRLAWLWMTGNWPVALIDHRDGDGGNNRWRNLRSADQSQNMANRRVCKQSSTGLKGVHFHKKAARYTASIRINQKSKHLGCFDTAEEAHAVYVAAAEMHFGQFARAA